MFSPPFNQRNLRSSEPNGIKKSSNCSIGQLNNIHITFLPITVILLPIKSKYRELGKLIK